MNYKDIKISSNRSFGFVFSALFALIAFWPILKHDEFRTWSLIIAILFLILGFLNSKLLTPLNKIWFKLGIFLGNFVSPIVIAIIFFLVVTPTGVFMRIIKKDLINLKKNNKKSYWIIKNDIKSSMKNQF